jgi:hypothetical protein
MTLCQEFVRQWQLNFILFKTVIAEVADLTCIQGVLNSNPRYGLETLIPFINHILPQEYVVLRVTH